MEISFGSPKLASKSSTASQSVLLLLLFVPLAFSNAHSKYATLSKYLEGVTRKPHKAEVHVSKLLLHTSTYLTPIELLATFQPCEAFSYVALFPLVGP